MSKDKNKDQGKFSAKEKLEILRQYAASSFLLGLSVDAEVVLAVIDGTRHPEVAERRLYTFDADTGEVVGARPLTNFEAGLKIASEVLPGMSPEEVDVAYERWMGEDQ